MIPVASLSRNRFPDLRIIRKASGFQFRKDLLPIDGYLKASAVGGNENQALDSRFEFGNELLGQTDRLGFVVSDLAVNDFDIHTLSV